ncbi:PAN domain-containing protein [Desulfonauticus submarinus]
MKSKSKLFFNILIISCFCFSLDVFAYNIANAAGYEYNVDRPGYDYKNFNLTENNPALCKDACDKDSRCKAWTFVKPGYQGSSPRCWLKYKVSNPVSNKFTISGVKNSGEDKTGVTKVFNSPSISGYRLDWCKVWGSLCGKPAADEFCKQRGFNNAIRWEIDPDIGLHSPTKIIGTGETCQQEFCDGFKYIECADSKSNVQISKGLAFNDDLSKYYIGCFKDSGDPSGTQGRDLDGFMYGSKDMTPEMCIDICSKRNFKYASVQYSTQCFCGNSYGKYGPANNCNMKCSGDSDKICGGFWANSVYKTNLTGGSSEYKKNTSLKFTIENCAVYKYKIHYLYGYIDESINPDTKIIFLSCMVKNVPKDTEITANWYFYNGAKKIFISSFPLKIKKSNYTGYITFTLEPSEGNVLPSGRYEIVITHKGNPIKTISFTYK